MRKKDLEKQEDLERQLVEFIGPKMAKFIDLKFPTLSTPEKDKMLVRNHLTGPIYGEFLAMQGYDQLKDLVHKNETN